MALQSKTDPRALPCDQCRHRKVRCDKASQCRQCEDASLVCTRNIVRQRRGPKKGSGSTIARLRHYRESPTSVPILNGNGSSSGDDCGVDGSPISITSEPNPLLSVNEFARQLLKQEFTPTDTSWTSLMGSKPITPGSTILVPFEQSYDSGSYTSPTSIASPTSTETSHPISNFSKSMTGTGDLRGLSGIQLPHPMLKPSIWAPRTSENTSPVFYDEYIDLFFTNLYPIWPILHETRFRNLLRYPERLRSRDKCLILALCAVTVTHVPSSTAVVLEARKAAAQYFINQCLQIRLEHDWIGSASIATIQTSFFISSAQFELKKARPSWIYLREAITLAQEMGLYEREGFPSNLDEVESLYHQRTIYFLQLSERGVTILRNKPISIAKFRGPPEDILEGEDPRIVTGLQGLSQVFSLLDESFVHFWNHGSQSNVQSQAKSKILAVQQTLNSMTFSSDDLTDIQRADILTTQEWLRLVFWQAAVRQGLVSSNAEDPALDYQYPHMIAKSLCTVLDSLSTSSIFVHGMGIVSGDFR